MILTILHCSSEKYKTSKNTSINIFKLYYIVEAVFVVTIIVFL